MAKVPVLHQSIKKRFPKYFTALENLGKAAKSAGPLDAKTAHLIQMAAAAAIRSEGSVHSHTRRALEAGASPEEIMHAILLVTSTVGFPNVSAALSWADEIIKEAQDRQ